MLKEIVNRFLGKPYFGKCQLEQTMLYIANESFEDALQSLKFYFPNHGEQQLSGIRTLIKLIVQNIPAEPYRIEENSTAMIYQTSAFVCQVLTDMALLPTFPSLLEARDYLKKCYDSGGSREYWAVYWYCYWLQEFLEKTTPHSDDHFETYRDLDFWPFYDFFKNIHAFSPKGLRGSDFSLFKETLYVSAVTAELVPAITEWSDDPIYATPLNEREDEDDDDDDDDDDNDDAFYGKVLTAEEKIDFFGEAVSIDKRIFHVDDDYEKKLRSQISFVLHRFTLPSPNFQ